MVFLYQICIIGIVLIEMGERERQREGATRMEKSYYEAKIMKHL